MRSFRAALAVAAAVSLAGCRDYQLPDPGDAAVRAEAERVARVAEGAGLVGLPGTRCSARLLGRDGATSYAWVYCEAPAKDGGPGSSTSAPVRVDGDRLRVPADGGGYAPSVRRLFPRRVADVILSRADRLRPTAPP